MHSLWGTIPLHAQATVTEVGQKNCEHTSSYRASSQQTTLLQM